MKVVINILVFFLILPASLSGQFSFLDDPYTEIEVEFLRKKLEGKPQEPFFNVLKLKNPTDRRLQFNSNISLPKGWTLMGEKKSTITLKPNDSLLIPIRAGISKTAKGDIGYAVVATLTDNKGKSFKNEYSFVNVPKKNKIIFQPEKRTYFINNATNQTSIKLNYLNKGNIDEVIYIEFDYDEKLEMQNGSNGKLKTEFLLPTNSDTTLEYNIKYEKSARNRQSQRKNHRIFIKSYTKDTVIQNAVWIKKLNKEYENYIPDRNRLLIIDIYAQNLFSEYNPVYNGLIKGSFLTKNAGSYFYRFQTMGKNFYDDPWRYSRMSIEYNYKKQSLEIGDVSRNYDQSLYGRGALAKMVIDKHELTLIGVQNTFNKSNQFGGNAKIKSYKNSYLELAGAQVFEPEQNQQSFITLAGIYIPFLRYMTFYARGGFSENTFHDYNKTVRGYGGRLTYTFRKNKFSLRTNLKAGNKTYTGNMAGRLRSATNLSYKYSDKLVINGNFNLYRNDPPVYIGNDLTQTLYLSYGLYSNFTNSQLFAHYHLKPRISIYGGPQYKGFKSNNFYNFDIKSELNIPNPGLTAGVKIRSKTSPLILNIRSSLGYIHVSADPDATPNKLHVTQYDYTNFELSTNLRSRNWGVFISYFDGAHTLNQHFQYIYYSYRSRLIRVLPQIDFFIYKDYIKVTNRSTFNFDLSARSNRFNISTIITGYPGKGWRLQFLNTYGYQSTYDDVVDEKYNYNNTYFELRVQKKFGFNQPRIKYYDLKIVFFKDLDSDGIKSKDEPGIENVLAKIDIDHTINDSLEQNSTGEGGFFAVELLSDIKGVVEYDNIPGGFYMVKYFSLGKMSGNFTSSKSNERIIMDQDKTVYIPFVENNKIFGSVILNRSKLSNLGNISPANIKITATDSKGNVYSTLTDKNGNFILYVPTVDKYKIHMNNIYYEHFNLEQNNFTVELNGYKQFEINFILNEKRRRINFSNNLELSGQDQDVRVIRRTNLGGSVKDAATFKPLKADVKIIDNESGNIVAQAKTDGNSGKFYVSYLAGKNYKLVITADGYWFYSENLPSSQITTFQNLKREVLLDYITVGSKVNLQSITFETDSDNLTPASMAELDRLANILKDNPGIELEIVGHCDNIEAIENIEIAEERARTVMSYLMKQGVSNLKFSSAGNSQPVNQGNTEEDRAKNRRVEAIVISK